MRVKVHDLMNEKIDLIYQHWKTANSHVLAYFLEEYYPNVKLTNRAISDPELSNYYTALTQGLKEQQAVFTPVCCPYCVAFDNECVIKCPYGRAYGFCGIDGGVFYEVMFKINKIDFSYYETKA